MASKPKPDLDLVEMTLEYQEHLPPEFFTDFVLVSSDLASLRRPATLRTRGTDKLLEPREKDKGWSTKLREAILEELHLLLCTKDPKYKDVRAKGRSLSRPGVYAVAGAIGAVIAGVPAGLITGAVAFFLLFVTKIGVNAFCRAYSADTIKKAK